jgi:hypothetical protein
VRGVAGAEPVARVSVDADAIFAGDELSNLAPTPGVVGRKPAPPASAAAPVAAAGPATPASATTAAATAAAAAVAASKKLPTNASGEVLLKELVRLEAALHAAALALDDARAKEIAAQASLSQVNDRLKRTEADLEQTKVLAPPDRYDVARTQCALTVDVRVR